MTLRQIADGSFPTRWAHFRLLGFVRSTEGPEELGEKQESAVALILGDIYKASL
jgi:GTP cyclohydrolase II